eukprot:m.474267 g.474267  ORF g.474267 m.474267 type:complete len:127 (-) comp21675_c1_seq2:144-524(-)
MYLFMFVHMFLYACALLTHLCPRMLRAAAGVATNATIAEDDYFSSTGQFRVDNGATAALRDSLLYKLSYHRFDTVFTEPGKPSGYDRVRRSEIARKRIRLTRFKEVYTSENWVVRVYELVKASNIV